MRLMKILGALVGSVLAFAAIALAKAQSRYDSDQQWIRKTIKHERRAEHHERHALQVEYRYRDMWQSNPVRRHYYAPSTRKRYHPRDWRYREERRADDRHEHHQGTRVYGVVMRKGSTTVMDATGHVECFPPIEARSHERQSEDNAWDDAQRSWQNTVRWKYGERFMDIRHAAKIDKRCGPSTVSESVAGKVVEAVRGAVGADDSGRRWRCEVRATPCLAPLDRDPSLKGDRQ